ncbi:response regulator [Ktedonobacter sp. SOSP1-85]|uniref:response regulator n=1 Tax=Ktedonobacter sp. SOSP1-85 TaxID=2778367 RepID=UPI001914FF1B|nr:response regulator [Ktedonobacter sp. SOSP1-85]
MKKKVLIAEDIRSLRVVCKHILRGNGYNVLEARTGEDAFWLSLYERPELVITSGTLRRTNGILLTRALATHRATSNIPLLFVVGTPSQEEPSFVDHQLQDSQDPQDSLNIYTPLYTPLDSKDLLVSVERFLELTGQWEGEQQKRA